jgi:hypothetical protein
MPRDSLTKFTGLDDMLTHAGLSGADHEIAIREAQRIWRYGLNCLGAPANTRLYLDRTHVFERYVIAMFPLAPIDSMDLDHGRPRCGRCWAVAGTLTTPLATIVAYQRQPPTIRLQLVLMYGPAPAKTAPAPRRRRPPSTAWARLLTTPEDD